MGKLWDFLSGAVNRSEGAAATKPFIHDSIDLKNYDVSAFLHWHSTGLYREMQGYVRGAYDNLPTHSQAVDILDIPNSNGWIIRCDQVNFNDADYRHLMYLIYTRLEKIGYKLNLADIKSRQKGNHIETTYRHYLKPSLKYLSTTIDGKANQLFGNITMVLSSKDGVVSSMKFLASSYSDQNYHPPSEFSELLDIVLED